MNVFNINIKDVWVIQDCEFDGTTLEMILQFFHNTDKIYFANVTIYSSEKLDFKRAGKKRTVYFQRNQLKDNQFEHLKKELEQVDIDLEV